MSNGRTGVASPARAACSAIVIVLGSDSHVLGFAGVAHAADHPPLY
jgi:hypothetical protein